MFSKRLVEPQMRMGRLKALVSTSLLLALVSGHAKDKSNIYETGKLLDMSVTEVTKGIAVIGGLAAAIPGSLYMFKIQLGDLVYFAEYKAGRLTEAQLRQLLGLQTREALDGFLKAHEVWLNYTKEDLERERAALRRLGFAN